MLTVARDSEAERALERAKLARREATADLEESKKRAQWFREQQAKNHFSPIIYDAMRPKQ